MVILEEFEKIGRRREKDDGKIIIGVDGSSADIELRYVESVVFNGEYDGVVYFVDVMSID